MEFEPAIADLLASPGEQRRRRMVRGAYPDGIMVEIRPYGGVPDSTHTPPLAVTIRLPGTVMTSTQFAGIAGVRAHLTAQGVPVHTGEWTVIELGRRR